MVIHLAWYVWAFIVAFIVAPLVYAACVWVTMLVLEKVLGIK